LRVLQTFHAESRTYWFSHWSSSHTLPEGDQEQSLTDYRLLGVVLGLAIYNNVLLDFPLPIALYRKICGHEVGLGDLEDFQPTIGKCALPLELLTHVRQAICASHVPPACAAWRLRLLRVTRVACMRVAALASGCVCEYCLSS
jgi:hypothetical protein